MIHHSNIRVHSILLDISGDDSFTVCQALVFFGSNSNRWETIGASLAVGAGLKSRSHEVPGGAATDGLVGGSTTSVCRIGVFGFLKLQPECFAP
jgi:hypothetical protein